MWMTWWACPSTLPPAATPWAGWRPSIPVPAMTSSRWRRGSGGLWCPWSRSLSPSTCRRGASWWTPSPACWTTCCRRRLKMRIDVVTIFPSIITVGLSEGIPARAAAKGIVDLHVHSLRDFTTDRHRTVDDTPYGGGPGMVMKPEPFFRAVDAIREQAAQGAEPGRAEPRVILLDPQGPVFNQAK